MMKLPHFLVNLKFWLYFTTLLLFSVTVVSRLLFNGMIFDFDYHLYQPDGAVYTFMALKFAGFSHSEAANRVISWYSIYGEPGTALNFEFFDPSLNSGVWSLGIVRVVYPILSVPFVLIFGIPGMLVVPVLSFLGLLLLVCAVAIKVNNAQVGLVVIFLLTTSMTVSRWYVANLTDGLLTTTLALATYLMVSRRSSRWLMWQFCSLIVIASSIRFSTPFWYVSAFLLFFLDKRRSVIVFFVSSISFIPTLLARPDPSSLVAGKGEGLIDKLVYFPVSAMKVLFIEFAQLAAIDRSLLLLLLTSIYISLRNIKQLSAQFFLLMGLAGWFVGSLNGVLGVNFRYQLPVLFFMAWTILENLQFSRKDSTPVRLEF